MHMLKRTAGAAGTTTRLSLKRTAPAHQAVAARRYSAAPKAAETFVSTRASVDEMAAGAPQPAAAQRQSQQQRNARASSSATPAGACK